MKMYPDLTLSDRPQPLSEEYLEQLKTYAAHHHEYPWSEVLLLCNALHAERERAEKADEWREMELKLKQEAMLMFEECRRQHEKAEADLRTARELLDKIFNEAIHHPDEDKVQLRDHLRNISRWIEGFLAPPVAQKEKS